MQGPAAGTPSDAALTELKRSNFAGTETCYSYYTGVLTQLGLKPGARVFDYGCSWGYGSYQLAQFGFEVTSFEVAPTRRRYAREKLGVSTIDDVGDVATDLALQFDCFFSAHVLEHVPSPAQSFNYAMRLLKPGGLFVSLTPNGDEGHRSTNPNWSNCGAKSTPILSTLPSSTAVSNARRVLWAHRLSETSRCPTGPNSSDSTSLIATNCSSPPEKLATRGADPKSGVVKTAREQKPAQANCGAQRSRARALDGHRQASPGEIA